jgi:hypothetical protein
MLRADGVAEFQRMQLHVFNLDKLMKTAGADHQIIESWMDGTGGMGGCLI